MLGDLALGLPPSDIYIADRGSCSGIDTIKMTSFQYASFIVLAQASTKRFILSSVLVDISSTYHTIVLLL